LIEHKYSEILENEYEGCTLFIASIPQTLKPTKVIVELKKISDKPSSEHGS
jgi:hypothetical protein